MVVDSPPTALLFLCSLLVRKDEWVVLASPCSPCRIVQYSTTRPIPRVPVSVFCYNMCRNPMPIPSITAPIFRRSPPFFGQKLHINSPDSADQQPCAYSPWTPSHPKTLRGKKKAKKNKAAARAKASSKLLGGSCLSGLPWAQNSPKALHSMVFGPKSLKLRLMALNSEPQVWWAVDQQAQDPDSDRERCLPALLLYRGNYGVQKGAR